MLGLEVAGFGRAEPAVESSGAKVPAKPGADRFPGRLDRRGARARLDDRIGTCAYHVLAPPLRPPGKRQKDPRAPAPSRARRTSFSLFTPSASPRPEFPL